MARGSRFDPKLALDQKSEKNLFGAFAHHSPAGGDRGAFHMFGLTANRKLPLTVNRSPLHFTHSALRKLTGGVSNKDEAFSSHYPRIRAWTLTSFSALLLRPSNTKYETSHSPSRRGGVALFNLRSEPCSSHRKQRSGMKSQIQHQPTERKIQRLCRS